MVAQGQQVVLEMEVQVVQVVLEVQVVRVELMGLLELADPMVVAGMLDLPEAVGHQELPDLPEPLQMEAVELQMLNIALGLYIKKVGPI